MRLRLWLIAALLPLLPAVARADDDPICADRPTKAFAPCTAPQGHVQVEVGLFDGQFQRQDGVTTDTWTGPEPTLKYGLTDRLDLEADIPLYLNVRTHDAEGSTTADGIGDLTLAAKYVVGPKDGPLTVALRPFLLVPTAPHSIGEGGFEGGVVVPVQWKIDDAWSVDTSPSVEAARGDGGAHLETIQLVGVQRTVGKALTLAAELWSEWSLKGGGRLSQASADLAAAYVIGKDLQLDAGVNLGLNRETPGAEVYTGISRRF